MNKPQMVKSLREYRVIQNSEYVKQLKDILEKETFALECVAHLQGRERELLPICDKARELLGQETIKYENS